MERKSGTELEGLYFVWNRCMEQSWNGIMQTQMHNRKENGPEVDIPLRAESRL